MRRIKANTKSYPTLPFFIKFVVRETSAVAISFYSTLLCRQSQLFVFLPILYYGDWLSWTYTDCIVYFGCLILLEIYSTVSIIKSLESRYYVSRIY